MWEEFSLKRRRPVSMRRGFGALSAGAATALRAGPLSGHRFVFRSERGDDLKSLDWNAEP
jgi:transposase